MDATVPQSLPYHLCDIYLEELNKIFHAPRKPRGDGEAAAIVYPAPLAIILNPFFTLAARTPINHTLQRVQSAIIRPLLTALSPPRMDDETPCSKRRRILENELSELVSNSCLSSPQTEGQLSLVELRNGLLKLMFDIAGDVTSRSSNRRKLYTIWRHYSDDEDDDHAPT